MSTAKSHSQDSPRAILKSTSILSVGTLFSRIWGFLRDVVLAQILGTGVQADALFVALKIPNLFRDLVGEGATRSAFVPVLSEYDAKKNHEEFWKFVSVILIWAMIVLTLITVLGMIFTPMIVRALAPGFIADPAKLDLTIRLTKLTFPYLIFIGLTAYSMSILFIFRSFAVPAFSPCLLNIAVIAGAFISPRVMKEPIYGLAIATLVGGFLQLAVHFSPMVKCGFRFFWPKTLRHPGAKQVGKLLLPRIFGSGVYQLSVFIDTFCASLSHIVGPGGISAIYYSNRIIQFPMGIFGVALASAALPSFSGMAARNDLAQLKKTLHFTLEGLFFVLGPLSILLMLLGEPMVRILFERGEFNAYSTSITYLALFCSAIGLFSFGGVKILVTAFHSMQDTKTPVIAAAVCLLINLILNFILMFPMKIGGIALASSIASIINFLVLLFVLDKRLGGLSAGMKRPLEKILVATFVAGAFVDGLWRYLPMKESLFKLGAVTLMGVFVYLAMSVVLKIEQSLKIWQWISKRKSKISR